MAIRGILFDKDGTVIDYWRTWVPINREVALFAAGATRRWPTSCCASAATTPTPTAITPGSAACRRQLRRHRRAFAAHLGGAAPPDLTAGIERIFRRVAPSTPR